MPLVACSSTLCALPRCASQQLVRGAAGDDVVGEQVGDVVEGAGAGGLAVQAPPHVCQELLGEGRPGGLAGDPARRAAGPCWKHGPGLVLQSVEVEAGLASSSPDPGPCVEEL